MDDRAPDLSVFDPVPTQLFVEDRGSILAIRNAVIERFGEYAYLEIGSYLGGSLQPHLNEPRCVSVLSIDARPAVQPDERGIVFDYPDNTSERMRATLSPVYGPFLGKLKTFDADARDVPRSELVPAPRLCLIDGEHTDRAVVSDFRVCLTVSARPAVILFDDAHIVYRGIGRCLELLARESIPYRAYFLPRKIGVIEIGDATIHESPRVRELLASSTAYLYLSETLDPYRLRMLRLLGLPGIRQLRLWRARILSGGRPSGGSRAS